MFDEYLYLPLDSGGYIGTTLSVGLSFCLSIFSTNKYSRISHAIIHETVADWISPSSAVWNSLMMFALMWQNDVVGVLITFSNSSSL